MGFKLGEMMKIALGLITMLVVSNSWSNSYLQQFNCQSVKSFEPDKFRNSERLLLKIEERRNFENRTQLEFIKISLGTQSERYEPAWNLYHHDRGDLRVGIDDTRSNRDERYYFFKEKNSQEIESELPIKRVANSNLFKATVSFSDGAVVYICIEKKYKVIPPVFPKSIVNWDEVSTEGVVARSYAKSVIERFKSFEKEGDKQAIKNYFLEDKEVGQYYRNGELMSDSEVEILEEQLKNLPKEQAEKIRSKYLFTSTHNFKEDFAKMRETERNFYGEKTFGKVELALFFLRILDAQVSKKILTDKEEILEVASVMRAGWCSFIGLGGCWGGRKISDLEIRTMEEGKSQLLPLFEKFGIDTGEYKESLVEIE